MNSRRAVYTRFTDAEYQRLMNDAEFTGKPAQVLLKERYFSKRPLIPIVPATEAKKIFEALNRLVSELNLIQIRLQSTPFDGLFSDLDDMNQKLTQIRNVIMTKVPDSLCDKEVG